MYLRTRHTVMGKRRKELALATTLEVRDACYALHLQRAARVVSRRYDESLRTLGLTSGQFALLMSLNRPERPTITAVASVLGMDPTTLTANLKPLARAEFLEVFPDSADRRQRRLKLTSSGKALLVDGLPIWRDLQRQIEQILPPGHRDRLLRDLLALSGAAKPPA